MKDNNDYVKKRKILDLQQKLEDVQMEKKMTFEQKGLHIWSGQVADQFSEFDREIEFYQKQIEKLKKNKK